VCSTALTAGTGPFDGFEPPSDIVGEPPVSTQRFDATEFRFVGDTFGLIEADPPILQYWWDGTARVEFDFPMAGTYRITVSAEGVEGGDELPNLEVRVGDVAEGFDVSGGGFADYSVELSVSGGRRLIDLIFANAWNEPDPDMNRSMRVRGVTVEGPLAGSTAGTPETYGAVADQIRQLFERILLRAPNQGASDDEIVPLYSTLLALDTYTSDRDDAWGGVCEALMHHPDFLFTRPVHFDVAPLDQAARLLLIKTAFDLLDRPPTVEEFTRFDTGTTREQLIDEWLSSVEFRDAIFHRARIILKTDGTVEGDELARLLTHLFIAERPIKELLTGDYAGGSNPRVCAGSTTTISVGTPWSAARTPTSTTKWSTICGIRCWSSSNS
jgi:hypothetical protein